MTDTITKTDSAKNDAKTVLDDMESRRIFDTVDDAVAYITKCMTDLSDFGDYPIAAPGLGADDEGNLVFDPDVYPDGTRVMVAVLTQRGEGSKSSTVKAIVIAPVPTIDAIMGNPDGRAWAERILEKELNHVAVRQLRKAEDIGDAVDSMPRTLADYVTSNREPGGMLLAFETLWRRIKKNMGKLSKSWKLLDLNKRELRRGLESASYAEEYYPTLEKSKQGSLFVLALQGLIATAKKEGLDPSLFERWIEQRDEKVIESEDEEEEDFSLEDLTAAMIAPAEEAGEESQEEAEEETATVEETPAAE